MHGGDVKVRFLKSAAPHILLGILCVLALMACLPCIYRNIEDPNLIVYFSQDEGHLMDHAWFYYTGQKRDSFQFETDYGLELIYLAGLSRAVLSKFILFTPVIFILILRWLNVIFWVASYSH